MGMLQQCLAAMMFQASRARSGLQVSTCIDRLCRDLHIGCRYKPARLVCNSCDLVPALNLLVDYDLITRVHARFFLTLGIKPCTPQAMRICESSDCAT